MSKKPYKRKYPRVYNLTKEENSILYGTLLGDASIGIQPGGVTPRLQMRHSIKQRHWFYFKVRKLSRLASKKSIHLQKPDGYSKSCKLHFQSLSHPALNGVLKKTHIKDKKLVKAAWLKEITPLALTVWWIDDGGLIGNRRKGRWNVLFKKGKKGAETLVNFLAKKYKIQSKVASYVSKVTKKRYYYIYIQTLALKRLLCLMLPFVPCRQMLYKFFLVYKDPIKQQHWITIMKNAVPQFSSEIDRLAAQYHK